MKGYFYVTCGYRLKKRWGGRSLGWDWTVLLSQGNVLRWNDLHGLYFLLFLVKTRKTMKFAVDIVNVDVKDELISGNGTKRECFSSWHEKKNEKKTRGDKERVVIL